MPPKYFWRHFLKVKYFSCIHAYNRISSTRQDNILAFCLVELPFWYQYYFCFPIGWVLNFLNKFKRSLLFTEKLLATFEAIFENMNTSYMFTCMIISKIEVVIFNQHPTSKPTTNLSEQRAFYARWWRAFTWPRSEKYGFYDV